MKKLKNIYLYVLLEGIVLGNGGYIALTALYEKLSELGYTVYFFDPTCNFATPKKLIEIRPESQYLSCENLYIVGLPFIQRDNALKIIISGWMIKEFYDLIIQNNWQNNFIFWDHGQLFRKFHEDKIQLVKSLLDENGIPLLISNRYLESIYREFLPFNQFLYLDLFTRDSLFYYDKSQKKENLIGYQPEARPDQIYLRDITLQITDFLKQHIEENELLFCTGSHKDVADKMRQCDIFFWHNLRSVNPDMFAGESMGLSHIEAAACGCVVIAKQNYVTQQIYPPELLCSSPEQGLQKLKFLLSHPEQKESLRMKCLQIAKNYRFDGFDNDRIETIHQITQIPGQAASSQRLEEESFTQVNHINHQKKNTKTISKENTCIMLIDLWPLSNQQIQQLGPVYLAWLRAREKIAELVKLANADNIPIYLQNNNWPISIPPASLKQEFLKSNLIIAPGAFAEDGYKHNTSAGPPTEQLIKNTVDYRDYDNLIYAGFAADACLAQRNNYGYASVSDSHNKFIIKDATLVQHILYHGKVPQLWPEYSRVMKARGPDEPLPWKGPEDIINGTIFFCDNFASKFCTPLFLDELKQMLPLSPAKKSAPTLIDSGLKHSLDISFLMEADWGWGCFLEDYVLLYGVLSMIKPNKILEIGTNQGLGAVVLAKAASFLSESAHVTSIDIDQSKAKSNLHLIDGIENKITFIEENANTILPELAKKGQGFDFIFIDGAHDYEQASQDWKNCSVLSDTFAFHDTTQFTGLQQLIRELRYTNEFDIFQFASPPGHRIKPELRKETFSTGLTLVQRKTKLTEIPVCAHRDHYGQLLPGHSE